MESEQFILTPALAMAFIRKARGKALFIAAGQSAPVADKPGYAFPVMGNVRVSRKLALKFLADTYSQVMADKGAMVVIRTLHSCIFIGQAA